MFEDGLAGYGKSLQNLLAWSLGFVVLGAFVFGREAGMKTKTSKDDPYYAGKYHAFWYSLDLFLPIIKLGEADIWTPRDDRRCDRRLSDGKHAGRDGGMLTGYQEVRRPHDGRIDTKEP